MILKKKSAFAEKRTCHMYDKFPEKATGGPIAKLESLQIQFIVYQFPLQGDYAASDIIFLWEVV